MVPLFGDSVTRHIERLRPTRRDGRPRTLRHRYPPTPTPPTTSTSTMPRRRTATTTTGLGGPSRMVTAAVGLLEARSPCLYHCPPFPKPTAAATPQLPWA